MFKWLCLALCCNGVVDAFGFGPMSTNGFQFSLPGFSSWPSDSTIVGNVRERFNKMLTNFGKEKSGLKTKVRNDNEGDRSVTTVTQDGNGYHSITRFSEGDGGQRGQHHRRRHHKGRNRNLKRHNFLGTADEEAANGDVPSLSSMHEDMPVVALPESACSGSDPCGEMHFCNPLTNICQKVQPEGSTCQFKNQCGPPELGIRCIWGRCAQAAQGSLGSLCIRDRDCLPNAYCTLHQSISPFYPMCTPKLDEGATCGVPRSDLNPLTFVGSLFGSKCAVEKPQHDYCKGGLKCAPVGWFGSYVCVPISLKVTPYACGENDQENTIGEGTYPEEPVTEEILEQEIEEQADREGNGGPADQGNKEDAEATPSEQGGSDGQGSVSISIGDNAKEGKESQTQDQGATSPEEGSVQQTLQAIAEKIKQAGQASSKEDEEERQEESEEEREENSIGTSNMSEDIKTKLKEEAQKDEKEKQTPAGQSESDATESTDDEETASPQGPGTGEDESGDKGTAKPIEESQAGPENGPANEPANGQGNGPANAPADEQGNGPANGHGNKPANGQGNRPASGQGNGPASEPASEQGNGPANEPASEQGNGPTNGQDNGQGNELANGPANGQGNRPGNGPANGQGNRPANGQENGPANEPAKGQGNGPANGQGNGPANEPANGPGKGAESGPENAESGDEDEDEDSKSGSGEEEKQEQGPKYSPKNEQESKGESQPGNGGTIAGEDDNSETDSTDQNMKPKGRKDAPGPSGMPAEGTLTPGETKDEKEKAKKVKESEENGSAEPVSNSGQEVSESGRRPSNAGPQQARRPVNQTYQINPLYVPPAGTGPRPPPQQPPPRRRKRKGRLSANQYQGGLYQAAQARPWYPAMQQPQQQPAVPAQNPWAQRTPYRGRRRKGRPKSNGKQE